VIDILFEVIEENHPPRYELVEVEDENGKSVGVGRWLAPENNGGRTYQRLRITADDVRKARGEQC